LGAVDWNTLTWVRGSALQGFAHYPLTKPIRNSPRAEFTIPNPTGTGECPARALSRAPACRVLLDGAGQGMRWQGSLAESSQPAPNNCSAAIRTDQQEWPAAAPKANSQVIRSWERNLRCLERVELFGNRGQKGQHEKRLSVGRQPDRGRQGMTTRSPAISSSF